MSGGDWLNSEQRAYVDDLNKIPASGLCYCGWFRLGECPHCPAGMSAADKIARACPLCRNAPPAEQLDRSITHIINCPNGTKP
jgi:hypothetical protein